MWVQAKKSYLFSSVSFHIEKSVDQMANQFSSFSFGNLSQKWTSKFYETEEFYKNQMI